MKKTKTLFDQAMTYQYWSKWREEWIDFSPTKGQLMQLKLYHYHIRLV